MAIKDLRAKFEEDVMEVSPDVAPGDLMHRDDPEHYFQFGQSAVRAVRHAMLGARKEVLESILDFGCGHGRVLRTLKAAFPEASLTACDVDRNGVDYCAQTFGATPVYSSEDPDAIELPGAHDLIWCGSVLTHVDRDRWKKLLGVFESALAPYGLLVFTTLGRFSVEKARKGEWTFGLAVERIERLVSEYERGGFGYVEYPDETKRQASISRYGLAFSSPSWVCAQLASHPDLRIVTYAERMWVPQDVVGCVRAPLAALGL